MARRQKTGPRGDDGGVGARVCVLFREGEVAGRAIGCFVATRRERWAQGVGHRSLCAQSVGVRRCAGVRGNGGAAAEGGVTRAEGA
jgi:hypothetical protein